MFVPVKCHIRIHELGSIATSLVCPVVVLLCFACLVSRTISRPFEATNGGLNDENRMKEMRCKKWSVQDLITLTNFKMADT